VTSKDLRRSIAWTSSQTLPVEIPGASLTQYDRSRLAETSLQKVPIILPPSLSAAWDKIARIPIGVYGQEVA